jgi:hypothetical protein
MGRKIFSVLGLLGWLAAFSITGAQQGRSPQAEAPKTGTARFGNPTGTARGLQNYVYGVVKKIGKAELVLDKTEFGDDQPFKLDAKAKYIRDGKPGKLDDFKAGDKVFVQTKKDKKSGNLIATRVVSGALP